MTQRIEKTIAIIAEAKTIDEAQVAIQNAHPQLSKKAALNVVKDLQDFMGKTMSISELDYRLAESGI